jgi:hypothetical protein
MRAASADGLQRPPPPPLTRRTGAGPRAAPARRRAAPRRRTAAAAAGAPAGGGASAPPPPPPPSAWAHGRPARRRMANSKYEYVKRFEQDLALLPGGRWVGTRGAGGGGRGRGRGRRGGGGGGGGRRRRSWAGACSGFLAAALRCGRAPTPGCYIVVRVDGKGFTK